MSDPIKEFFERGRRLREAATPGPWGDWYGRISVFADYETVQPFYAPMELSLSGGHPYPFPSKNRANDNAYISYMRNTSAIRDEMIQVAVDALKYIDHECMHSDINCPTRDGMKDMCKSTIKRITDLARKGLGE